MSSIDHVNKSILNPDGGPSPSFRRIFEELGTPVLKESPDTFQNQIKQHSLKPKSSTLDLIDDTKLTSLPLPPPAKSRKMDSETYNDSMIINTTYDLSYDDSFDVGDDPIVLVEDYVQKPEKLPHSKKKAHEHAVSRKQSLDIFKRRLNKYETLSLLSCNSTVLTSNMTVSGKRKISEELTTTSETYATRPKEDIEEIFGKIPGSDNLKYCDICNRPLYEISTVISNNKRPKKEYTTNSQPTKSLYKEFVCWECVDTYEEFFNELYWTESRTETSHQTGDTQCNQNLLRMFKDILQKYQIEPAQGTFSPLLLGTLHHHLGQGERHLDLAWLERLRQKLRWRWRLNGLIPHPFGAN